MGSIMYINREIYMYYLVNVDHNSMTAHLTISDCEGSYEMPYIQSSGCG
jgi:hypothetical protein